MLRGGAPAADIVRLTRTTYDGPLVVGSDLMRFGIGREVTVEGNALDGAELSRPAP